MPGAGQEVPWGPEGWAGMWRLRSDPGTELLHWQVGSLTTEPPGNPLARLFSTLSWSLLVACTQPRDQPEVIA